MKRDQIGEMEAVIASLEGRRPRLLLHSCCAPCTSSVLERLYPHFEVTLYYYNPNTYPEEEYKKRGDELPKLLRASGMEDVDILWGDYEPRRFFDAARGLEDAPEGGARCGECFALRLEGTAERARAGGFEFFCSTLTVSPHKNAAAVNAAGESAGTKYGVRWLPSDFKKRDGYLRSLRLSALYGLYRQCYCGCLFSRDGDAAPPII